MTGTLTTHGIERSIESGSGWYDHEFGRARYNLDFAGKLSDERPEARLGWNWVGLQFDNGHELTAFTLHDLDEGTDIDQEIILTDENGSVRKGFPFSLRSNGSRRSMRS